MFMRRKSRKVGFDVISTMDRVVDATTGNVLSVYKQHRRLQRVFRKQTTTTEKQNENRSSSKLGRPISLDWDRTRTI
jgi:hypothetical protein